MVVYIYICIQVEAAEGSIIYRIGVLGSKIGGST